MSWCRHRRGPASLARAAGRQNADRDAGWRPRPSGLRQLRVQRRDTRTPHSAAERLADRGDPGQAGAAGDRILLGRGRPDLLPRRSRRGTAPVRRALAERSSCCPRWRLRGDGLAVSPQLAVLDSAVASRQRCRASRVAVRGSTAACRGMPPRSAPANRRIPPRSHGRPPCPSARTPERTRKSRTAIRPAHQATGTHPEATNGHPARPPAAGTRREVMNGHHARLNCRRIPPPSHWRRAGGPSADGAGLSRRRPMSDRRSHEGHEHLVDDGLGHRIGNRLERHQQLLPVEVEGN